MTEDFNEYLKRKRIDSAHGNHIEMQAISELYNRPVEVYQYSLGMYHHRALICGPLVYSHALSVVRRWHHHCWCHRLCTPPLTQALT